MRRVAATILIGNLLAVFLCYCMFVHWTPYGHAGIMRNWVTGELKLDTPGWNLTAPWVTVAKIDARPMRVCVTTAGRGFNCKLVQFESTFFQKFVETEGFYYYWWANRISFNGGYGEEYRGAKDLIRGYAYSVKPYQFVKILRDEYQ